MDEQKPSLSRAARDSSVARSRGACSLPAKSRCACSREIPRRRARALDMPGVEFVRADIAEPASLKDALRGADTIVDAIQFDGYPVENPRRGLTFERIDYAGAVALIDAAKQAGVRQFIYISGAAADENSHPSRLSRQRPRRARDPRVGPGLHDLPAVAGVRTGGQSRKRSRPRAPFRAGLRRARHGAAESSAGTRR